jgi:hypothetical protein
VRRGSFALATRISSAGRKIGFAVSYVRPLDRGLGEAVGSTWTKWLVHEGQIPEDGVIEPSEADAARLLCDRRSARDFEVLGWAEDESAEKRRGAES